MALRNVYKQARNSGDLEAVSRAPSVEQLTRGVRRQAPAPPGPVNPATAQTFIADQFSFLQTDNFSPYTKYADTVRDTSYPGTENGILARGIQDNFSFGPPALTDSRARADGADTDVDIGLAKDLMSRFNPGFVPDHPDDHVLGYADLGAHNGIAREKERATRIPPTGRENDVYVVGTDPRNYARSPPNYGATRIPPTGRENDVHVVGTDPRNYARSPPNYGASGRPTEANYMDMGRYRPTHGEKPRDPPSYNNNLRDPPSYNNNMRDPPRASTDPPTPVRNDKKDSYYSKNKRCLLAVILVIVALIVVAVVAILVLFFLGYFEDSPVLNVEYGGEVRFNVTWSPELANHTSDIYMTTSEHFMSLMSQVLEDTTHKDQHEVNLIQIQPGSIRCLFRLLLSSVDDMIETTVDSGLKALFHSGATDWYTEYTNIEQLTTTPGPTSTPSSTVSGSTTLIYTTPGRYTPEPVTCKPIPEALCTVFDYDKSGTSSALRFNALYPAVQRECYTHALQYACVSSYPPCSAGLERYPCRQFCDSFTMNCSFPVNCEGFLDDDINTLCYVSPEPKSTEEIIERNPPPVPCGTGEFQCGDGRCIPESRLCDGVDHCGDFSDETNCVGLTSPLDCNFELNDVCRYGSYGDGDFAWSLQVGATPSLDTGPLTDHTHRTPTGHYLYAEASGQYPYSRAGLLSVEVSLQEDWCLRFYYHMLGAQVEHLQVHQYFANNAVDKEQLLWQRSRHHGDDWRFGAVTLPAGTYQVLWVASTGPGYRGDIAIDDITAREGACPSESLGCSVDEFQCANQNCVLYEFVCDSYNDCGDLSDEKPCNCTASEFQCDFGMCVPDYMRCDGLVQCSDGSDENNCQGVCSNGRHPCSDGTCIMQEWVCDHEADCPDESDELDCSTCGTEQFRCRDYGCVNESDICDGSPQCADGSDEFSCFRTRDDNVVEVLGGQDWRGLCAEALPSNTATHVCQLMGYMTSLSYEVVVVTGGNYVKYMGSGDPADNFLSQLHGVDSCTNDEVLSVQCLVPDCGKPTVDDHVESYIVHGQDARPGQWPWQIGLYYNNLFSCGGSLVSHHHVITAAHCLKVSREPNKYHVIVGATWREPGDDDNRMEVGVAALHQHPGYTLEAVWGDDIAVLTLDQYIPYNDFIKPLCLPNDLDQFPTTSQCYTTGWGRTDYYNTSSVPLRLQEAKMKLWSDKKCGQAHISFKDGMTCAGYDSGYISNCPGDSGGPLQCRDPQGHWKLYGAFSFFVRGCNVPLQPPVFTKVQSYLPWILEQMDCAFICDNQRCIWDDALLCNGVDDCGDLSDEITMCNPTMDCTFDEGPYQCGYSHTSDISKSSWARLTWSRTVNTGPVSDITRGNSSGYFMYAGVYDSVLVSPITTKSGSSCLQLEYHMRGPIAGTLTISMATVPDHIQHPSLVDLSTTQLKQTLHGNKYDIWHSLRVNLDPGRFVVVFSASSQNPTTLPLVAIDDVQLIDGTCESITCGEGEVDCGDRCVPPHEVCNYHPLCSSSEDEAVCGSSSSRDTYSCDMENYGLCRLEQSLFLGSDTRDWTLLETEDFGNLPPDHTTGSYGGHVMYYSTLVGSPGDSAVLQLPISVPSFGDHCLQFFYSMISTGALRLMLCGADGCELKWSVQDDSIPGWESVQVPITSKDSLVQIFGYTGAFSSQPWGYIFVDDISIQSNACPSPSCLRDQFRCSDGTCIEGYEVCDARINCLDGSDESSETCECLPDMFQCGDGSCIKGGYLCDGYDDCTDSSDETNCSTCTHDDFVCSDNTCRNQFVWCDGVSDCADDSDEPDNCACRPDQFQCVVGIVGHPTVVVCIPGFRYCDGVLDCVDGSDEPVTGCNSCDPRWHFDCGDGTCILKEQQCDGVAQCASGRDEHISICQVFVVAAACSPSFLPEQVCDGFPDCPGAVDESPDCECPTGYVACQGGGCYPVAEVCDGKYDCKDHSDELNCNCGLNTRQCSSGMCYSVSRRCDGFVDCDDWSDELQCSSDPGCGVGQFACDNGVCIDSSLRCNRDDNCGDASDEIDCSCGVGEFSCAVDKTCITALWRCDGVEDCSDGADETDCTSCPANTFQCRSDKSCITLSRRCDNSPDCPDNSDEANCERANDDGFLEVWRLDGWVAVCSTNWQSEWNQQICTRRGKGLVSGTGFEALTVAEYLVVDSGTPVDTEYSPALLSSGTCTSGKAVKLTCDELLCQSDSFVQPLIIGGSLPANNKWPWMGALQYLGGPRCGATLVDQQWLVTAAHCFSNPSSLSDPVLSQVPQYFSVLLGNTRQVYIGFPDHVSDVSRVVEIITHPLYHVDSTSGVLFHDIALVRLTAPVQLSPGVRPLCLPEQDQDFNQHSECYSAGWGFIDSQASQSDFGPVLDLRDGRFRLWSAAECEDPQAWGTDINSTVHVCAGLSSGAVSTCHGDSGGPLMCRGLSGRWDLVGVTSAGANCGQGAPPTQPGIFSKVAHYRTWIQTHIEDSR